MPFPLRCDREQKEESSAGQKPCAENSPQVYDIFVEHGCSTMRLRWHDMYLTYMGRESSPSPSTSPLSASSSTRVCPCLPLSLCLWPCVSNTRMSTLHILLAITAVPVCRASILTAKDERDKSDRVSGVWSPIPGVCRLSGALQFVKHCRTALPPPAFDKRLQ